MNIDLGPISIDPSQYGIQGNAILGIKETGKSYFATMMGERLMDAGIPIVALDPIGIWRFLRVAGTGLGFPIVVAGGEHGDLPLSPENATEIMRAALREGISVVFDLYSMELSKSDWRKIVEAVVRTLLYENKGKGVRHVFIEEAAEFAPQRVGPDQGRVYAEIEKMARMGGNAQVGYTLINPRAAEVNKAVLELCDSLFLFRQKGKNAIEGLGKWLEAAGAAGAKEIQRTLSTLSQGECWAWLGETAEPVHIERTPPKRTFHPDRRAAPQMIATAENRTVDVSAFVEQMRGSLAQVVAESKANDPAELKKTIADLRRKLQEAQAHHETAGAAGAPSEPDPGMLDAEYRRGFAEGEEQGRQVGLRPLKAAGPALADLIDHLKEATNFAADIERLMEAPVREIATVRSPVAAPRPMREAPAAPAPRQRDTSGSIPGPQQRILDAVRWWESVGIMAPSRVQVAIIANYSPRSTSFTNPLSACHTGAFVEYPSPGTVALTAAGRKQARGTAHNPTTEELHGKLQAILPGPQWRILSAVIGAYPRSLTREEAAERASYSASSTSFTNPLSALHTAGLIDYPQRGRVVALPILFIEGKRL